MATYRFPPQEYKYDVGARCYLAETLAPAGEIVCLDLHEGIVQLRPARPLPEALSLIPTGPIETRPLRKALYRFARSIAAGSTRYVALAALLARSRPTIHGLDAGAAFISEDRDVLGVTIDVVRRLRDSHLFIQGPPGAGKTFTAAHAIVAMIAEGKKVGVMSNSHKAINNLLREVEKRAEERGVRFRGVKKSTQGSDDSFFHGHLIVDVTSNEEVDGAADLIAGTAWLFCREKWDRVLDYLFVDEAGQVSLANVVAAGLSARNIVLVGDQMQLGQPIQGVHPGESGQSVLEYLLQDRATIPPEEGVFLPTTWRMHEDVCRFISDAIYEGRLHPEPSNQNQGLLLAADADPPLAPTGVRFVAVEHQGCSQKSAEEGTVLRRVYIDLLRQRYRDRDGTEHPMGADNILVVTPYNMQVNYLKSLLPAGARVGTVDKFQGQEAEVVLVSMATSGAEEMPRNLEFLYSRNRLNVAISRARCLSIIIASPSLLEIPCRTVDQMRLVNTLCWAREYGENTGGM